MSPFTWGAIFAAAVVVVVGELVEECGMWFLLPSA